LALCFNRIGDTKSPSFDDLAIAIDKAVKTFFWRFGLAKLSNKIIHYDIEKKTVIVRCQREYLQDLRSAILLLSEINKEPVNMYILKVSGTINL